MPLPLTEVIVAGQTGHVEHHNTIHDVVNRVEYFDTGIYTESFNKADSDTLGPDLTWTEVTGDSDVVSNTADFSTNGHMLARAEVDLGSPDHFSQMTVTQLDTTLTDARKNHVGVVCRKDNSSTLTYYDGRITRGGGGIEGYKIYKRIAGTETLLWQSLQALPALPFTIRLEVVGTSLRFYVNGIHQQTITDSSITTGNYTGMKVFRDTAATSPRADSFQAGAMASLSSFPTTADVFTDGTQSSQFQARVADALPKIENALLGGSINAADYGVLPTNSGVTNRINLGRAVAVAVGLARPLYLPAGNYTVTYDVSNKYVPVGGKLHLLGAGRGLTTITVNPTVQTFTDLSVFQTTAAGEVHISDLTVQGPTAGSGNDSFDENSTVLRHYFQGDLTLERLQVKGNLGSTFSRSHASDVTIRVTDCKMTGYRAAGDAFEPSKALTKCILIIDGCEIHDIEILGTSGAPEPDNVGFYIHPHFEVHCANSVFRNIPRFGIYMNTGTGAPTAQSKGVFIDNCSFIDCRGVQCTEVGTTQISNSRFHNSEVFPQGGGSVFMDGITATGSTFTVGGPGPTAGTTISMANMFVDLANTTSSILQLVSVNACRYVLRNVRFKNTGTATSAFAIIGGVSGTGPTLDFDGVNIEGDWNSGIYFRYFDKARIRNLTTNIASLVTSGRHVLVGGTVNELDIDGMHLAGAATQGPQMEFDSPSALLTANKVVGKDWRFTGASTAISFVGTVGQQRVIRRQGVAPTAVVSAATINLYDNNEKCSHNTFRISGTTTIDTITPGPFIGPVTLIATGAWATSATGNIKAKTGAARTVDQAYVFTYTPETSLWYEVA